MPARREREPVYRPPTPSWRVYRQLGGTKIFIGLVVAPDETTATEIAIQRFEITAEHQRRIVAEVRD
jgi:hypothetical protein